MSSSSSSSCSVYSAAELCCRICTYINEARSNNCDLCGATLLPALQTATAVVVPGIKHTSKELIKSLHNADKWADARIQSQTKKKIMSSKTDLGSGTGFGGKVTIDVNTSNITKASNRGKEEDKEIISILSAIHKICESILESEKNITLLAASLQASRGLKAMLALALHNDSIVDMSTRSDLYLSIFNLIDLFTSSIYTTAFLLARMNIDETNDKAKTCETLLTTLESAAQMYVKVSAASDYDNIAKSNDSTHKIVSAIIATSSNLKRSREQCRNLGLVEIEKDRANSSSSSSTSSSTSLSECSSAADYVSKIRDKCFDICDIVNITNHKFVKNKNTIERVISSRVLREVSSLLKDLPIEFSSSIIVRADESHINVLKALIIGPEGTPYENGCFEFDIMLSSQYPNVPPLVNLCTTGNGTVRFNPNLYNCGKVCLSLLGTWQGPGWMPSVSTLLQVLISIQSLILVPDPYYNEPGYAIMQNTPRGNKESELYNTRIKANTVTFAILGQLRNPSPIFADVIRDHFAFKLNIIRKQLKDWKLSDKIDQFNDLLFSNNNTTSTTLPLPINCTRATQPVIFIDVNDSDVYTAQKRMLPITNEVVQIDTDPISISIDEYNKLLPIVNPTEVIYIADDDDDDDDNSIIYPLENSLQGKNNKRSVNEIDLTDDTGNSNAHDGSIKTRKIIE